ncbi:MAG: alpha/beta hydrolase [Alphaproteobacteria bacterium]|nr:alpha/beta hydrolase [Alphaproteobacteria bacterium]
MIRFRRIAAAVCAAIVVALGGTALIIRSGVLAPSEQELRAKYFLPTSRMIEIDGAPIHYSDEGQGPVILMVHGTFGNLRMWNDWAALMSNRFRIVRFDRPPFGLSGPDPEGRYGADREAEIIAGLAKALGLTRFFLVATSSGGQSVTRYAAQHPEQIIGVVLSNIATGPPPGVFVDHRNTWFTLQSRKVSRYLNGWHPAAEWWDVLKTNFINHDRITDALVTEYQELNNRPASYLASLVPRPAVSASARTPGDLAAITAPALVLWSENDSERPPQPVAEEAMALLGSADKTLTIVPRCEHMMPVDCGPESAAAAAVFFDRIAGMADPTAGRSP